MYSFIQKNMLARSLNVVAVLVFAISIGFSIPGAAHAQYSGDGDCCDFGSADIYPNSYGSADIYPNSYGSADIYPDTYGSADIYPNSYGSADIYPNTSGYTLSPEYDTTGGYSLTPEYGTDTYGTPSYSTYGTPSYTASAPYASSIPSYSTGGAYYGSASAPFYGAVPSYGTAGAPSQGQSQYSSNSNSNSNTNYTPSYSTSNASATSNPTVTDTNTNTFNPTNTSTNTNTNTPTATVSQSGNSAINNSGNSSASTGPISVVNNVNVVPVQQQQRQYNAQYTLPQPSCTLSSSNQYPSYGGAVYNQPITLTWSSANATSAYISPQVGTVQPSGSTVVYPTGYTTYTMTISGPGGTATCQTTANYSSYAVPSYVAPTYVPPAPIYTQPAAPAVSLTQIPYTGFDYGTFGDSIYWGALMAFAAAAAYLLIYFRGGALAFAGSFMGSRNDSTAEMELNDEEETNDEPAPVAASVIAPEFVPAIAPATREIPTMAPSRMTSDSMFVDTMSGTPRIVIARN